MVKAVEIIVFINLVLIGASHLLRPDVWIEFFQFLKNHGRAGAFANGFLSLTFGGTIVGFHWVWEGLAPTLITCLGLAQLLKSFVAFVFPHIALRSLQRPMASNPIGYQIGGAVFLVLAVLLARHLWG